MIMNRHLKIFLMLWCGLVAMAALGDETQIRLKSAPGVEKVVAHCSGCHSLDYIQMNSPFPDRKLWEAEVAKMINAFAAPVPKDDVAIIVEYLVQQYGKP